MKILYLNQRTGAPATHRYMVTKTVNTVIFSIGEIVSLNAASDYCASSDWKVTITAREHRS